MDTISTVSMTFDELLRIAEEQRHVIMSKTRGGCSILVERRLAEYGSEIKIHVMYGPRNTGPCQYDLGTTNAAAAWLCSAVENIPPYHDPQEYAPWFTVSAEGCAA